MRSAPDTTAPGDPSRAVPSASRGCARRDLRATAPKGYLGFTGISVRLARAALKVLENDGPGAKVSRPTGQLQATLGVACERVERGDCSRGESSVINPTAPETP